ncbi:probable splicing factor, arginine/serine-rich 3 [Schistocerca gregaria]|uniref:probable splicing factor, arginine/serine-rich 3 n=1 Tax=Schistocerca gregaria TaxID=7010 RepID=UPI00211DB98E|nr:probable splicing factor, arginine/serine-rich 3 [Schistocerca gregaria]
MSSPPRLWVSPLSERVSESDLRSIFSKYGNVVHVSRKSNYAFIEFQDPIDADDAEKALDGFKLDGIKLIVQKARPREDRYRDRYSRDRYRDDDRDDRYDRRGYRDDFRSYRDSRYSSRWDDRRDDRYASRWDDRRYDRYRHHSPIRSSRDSRGRRFSPPRNTEHRLYVDGVTRDINWKDLKDHFRSCGDVCFADVKQHGDRLRGIVEFKYREDLERAFKELDQTRLRGVTIYLSMVDPDTSSVRSRSPSRSPCEEIKSPKEPSPSDGTYEKYSPIEESNGTNERSPISEEHE